MSAFSEGKQEDDKKTKKKKKKKKNPKEKTDGARLTPFQKRAASLSLFFLLLFPLSPSTSKILNHLVASS